NRRGSRATIPKGRHSAALFPCAWQRTDGGKPQSSKTTPCKVEILPRQQDFVFIEFQLSRLAKQAYDAIIRRVRRRRSQ
ncbi:hypothetical protein ACU6QH_00135, partial [Aeromonas veronii]|uniref:hypothetical protein n=1 Tax=Aeromonas veronii TaxID=654 RepID=UPI00406CF6EE